MEAIAINWWTGGKISILGRLIIEVLLKSPQPVHELYLPIYHYLCQKLEQSLNILIWKVCPWISH